MTKNKPKIIHILHHSPVYLSKQKFPPPNYAEQLSEPSWVGFYEGDWPELVAREILKRTEKYSMEFWRPYHLADKPFSKNINGVLHRLFPSEKITFRNFNAGERSITMLRALEKEILSKNVIIHLHGLSRFLTSSILYNIDLASVPVVVQNHEDKPYHYRIGKNGNNYFLDIYFYIQNIVQKNLIKKVNLLFVHTVDEKNIWESFGLPSVDINVMGVDSTLWCPRDKSQSREKLNLSKDKKVILLSSRLEPKKCIKEVLESYSNIPFSLLKESILIITGDCSNKRYLIELLKSCRSLDILKNVIFTKWLEEETLLDYYASSDLFITYSLTEGGPVSAMKALLMDIPVITSPTGIVSEFIEKENLGVLVKDNHSLTNEITRSLKSSSHPKTRTVSKEYFSWDKIIDRTLKFYDNHINN